MKKLRFVPDARQGWKWYSNQMSALNVAIVTVWANLPDDMRANVPISWVLVLVAVASAAGIIGRFIDQGGDA